MPDEILGSLGVEITGDASGLEDAISQATSAATDASEAISAAFSDTSAFQEMETATQGVADSLSTLSDAASGTVADLSDAGDAAAASGDQLDSLGTSATEAGSAVADAGSSASDAASGFEEAGASASEATGGINELSTSLSEAGAAAEEGGSGLSAFRGSLLELAEGLAVTEGLKELATEALTAYASIQTATVSLTAMSGSASQAEETIGGLEEMALKIPVALSSLVQSTQQMTAFGFSAEQANQMLTDSANAAAASGMGFQMVSDSLERMALSGMAGARQLATVGLSTTALAAQMGDFGVASDASAAEVQKAFRNLDVDQRLEVIDSALQKFSGIADDQANTVAGAWTILKNRWDETLEAVGADLAPLAVNFMSFATSAASAVQTAVDAFNKLPGPLQDLVGVAVVALGASGPILMGLAAVSLAVMGLQSIPEVFGRIATSIGLTGEAAATAAPEVETLATVLGTSGAAATAAAPEFAALGAAEAEATEAAGSMAVGLGPLGVALVATTVLVTAMFGEFQRGQATMAAFANTPAATPEQQQQIQNLDAAIKQLGKDIPDFNPASESITQYIAVLQKAASGATQFGGAAGSAKAELDALNSGLSINIGGMGAVAGATAGAQKAFDAAQASVEKLRQAVTDANGAVASAKQALADSTQGTDDYATAEQVLGDAQNSATKAQAALTSATTEHTKALSAHQAALEAAIVTVPTYADAIDKAATKIVAATNSEDAALQIAVGAWVQLATSATASSAQIDAAYAAVQTAVKKTGDDYTALGSAITDAMSRQGITLDSLVTQWANLASSGTATTKEIANAWQLVETAATAAGLSMSDLVDKVNGLTAAMPGLGAVIENGKLQLVGISTAAPAAAAGIEQLRGAAVPAYEAFQNFGATAVSLGIALKDIPNWTNGAVIGVKTLAGAAQDAGDGLIYATSAAGQATPSIVNYAESTGAAVAPTASLTQANQALADSFDAVAGAAGRASSATGRGGGGSGQGTSAEALSAMAYGMASNPATSMFVWGNAPPIGMGGAGGTGPQGTQSPADIAAMQYLQALQQAMAQAGGAISATTRESIALEYALTGGSLVPSLETTTESVGTLDQRLTTVSQSTSSASQNLANLFASVAPGATQPLTGGVNPNLPLSDYNATTGSESLSVVTTPGPMVSGASGTTSTTYYTPPAPTLTGVAGVSVAQLQELMAGGSINLGGDAAKVAQEMAAANAEIANYTAQLAAYNSNLQNQAVLSSTSTPAPINAPSAAAAASIATAGGTFSATAPSGTQISPTQIDNSAGQWYYSDVGGQGPGWYLQSAFASGPVSTTGEMSAGAAASMAASMATAGGNFSATAPSGTSVNGTQLDTATGQQAPEQIDTVNGDWFYANNGPQGAGWYRQVGTASGPVSTTGEMSAGAAASMAASMATAGGNFSATAPSGGTNVGGTVTSTTGAQVQGQIDLANGDWFYSAVGANGPGWYRTSGTASTGNLGATMAAPNAGPAGSGYVDTAQTAALLAWERAGLTGAVGGATPSQTSAPGTPPVTINVTLNGITPSNAQQMLTQMTTALRQTGLKIT